MATDFLEYSNLRLLIPKPAAPVDFRTGVPPTAGHWVVHAFARGPTSGGAPLPSVQPGTIVVSGYITATADLPPGGSWLAGGASFTWDESGLAPDGMRLGMGGRGFLGDLEDLPAMTGPALQGEATITSLGGLYGPGGIGGELRADIGDAITVELQVTA